MIICDIVILLVLNIILKKSFCFTLHNSNQLS